MKYYTLFLSLFILLACKQNNSKKNLSKVKENDQIEVYNFDQLDSVISSNMEKALIVNFWATWCKPCIKELPYFEQAQSKYEGDIKVILVSLDFANKLESQLIPFVGEKGLESQVILLDDPYENEWIPKVDSTWSGAIPATLMIDQDKRIFYEKSFSEDELEVEILKFIKT